jgi:hypothetical protein
MGCLSHGRCVGGFACKLSVQRRFGCWLLLTLRGSATVGRYDIKKAASQPSLSL